MVEAKFKADARLLVGWVISSKSNFCAVLIERIPPKYLQVFAKISILSVVTCLFSRSPLLLEALL